MGPDFFRGRLATSVVESLQPRKKTKRPMAGGPHKILARREKEKGKADKCQRYSIA